MAAIRRSPGPAAAEAFTLGIATTLTSTFAVVVVLAHLGMLTLAGAVAVLLMGLPLACLLAACLLSVWLGYDKDATDVALS
jgi:hypothetical protein